MKARTKSIKQNLSILQTSKPKKKSFESKIDVKQKNTNQSFIKPPKPITKDSQQAKKYLQKTLNILSHRFNIKNNESVQRSGSILNLSNSVYKIVKQNMYTLKKTQQGSKQNLCPNNHTGTYDSLIRSVNKRNNQKIKDQILKDSFHQNLKDSLRQNSKKDSNRKIIISQKQNCRQRASSALANYSILDASSICQQSSIIAQQNSVICNPQNIAQNIAASENSLFVKRRSNSTLDSYFRQKFGSIAEDVRFNINQQMAVQKKLRVIKALKKSQEIVNKSNRSHIKSSQILTNFDINDKSIVMDKLKNKKSEKIR